MLQKVCGEHPSPLGRILTFAGDHLEWPKAETEDAVQTQARHEIVKLERGLVVLEVITGIAPLLGLVGTIAGMMSLFLFLAAGFSLLAGFPVAFTLAGVALIFALLGIMTGTFDAAFLSAFPNRIFGIMSNETLIAVPVFVFTGVMLERSKLADQLLQALAQLMRRIPGGLGLAVMLRLSLRHTA